jgi:hypothetical protein
LADFVISSDEPLVYIARELIAQVHLGAEVITVAFMLHKNLPVVQKLTCSQDLLVIFILKCYLKRNHKRIFSYDLYLIQMVQMAFDFLVLNLGVVQD